MLSRLFTLFLVVALGGPLLAAYVLAPVEALAAWPVWSLSFVPALMVIVSGTFFWTYRPLVDAPLPASAGEWARDTVSRLGIVGLSVVTLDRGQENFYHPSSRTIVLADNVRDEHTARAYATAAHELGHALFHTQRPFLSRVLLAARGHAGRLFYKGAALLFGTVIAGDTTLRWLALALIAFAAVLQALVVVDETIASAIGGDLLRDHLDEAEQAGIARGHLRRALATYASLLVAFLVPFAAAPWILQGTGGVVPPGGALTGMTDTVADASAWLVVVGAVGAVVVMVSLRRGWFGVLGVLPALSWTPLFTVLLCDQPDLPAWTIALAVVPTWSVLVLPAITIVRWFGGKMTADVEMLPMPLRAADLRRVSMKDLAGHDEGPSLLGRVSVLSICLWVVPLTLAWIGWL